jgi:chromosome condensin MukBEF MukE localization factor
MNAGFERLEDVILDELFPEVDLSLRRGRHLGREDGLAYGFLGDAHDHLEPFYRRFGAELVHKSDGYFYLLPSNDRLGRSHLSEGEMLVGQAMALLYLDPESLLHGGVVSRELVLQRLASLVGQEDLVRVLHPRLRRADERLREGGQRLGRGALLDAVADDQQQESSAAEITGDGVDELRFLQVEQIACTRLEEIPKAGADGPAGVGIEILVVPPREMIGVIEDLPHDFTARLGVLPEFGLDERQQPVGRDVEAVDRSHIRRDLAT